MRAARGLWPFRSEQILIIVEFQLSPTALIYRLQLELKLLVIFWKKTQTYTYETESIPKDPEQKCCEKLKPRRLAFCLVGV